MKYIIKKIITLIIALLLISIITFVAFSVIPGDAALAKLGTSATPERLAELRHEMGLDEPVLVRYGQWLVNALHGDFGYSLQYTDSTVNKLIGMKLPYTLILSLLSFVMIIAASFPLGIFSAKKQGSAAGTVIKVTSQVGMSVPAFFLGMILTLVLGIGLKLFAVGLCPDIKTDFAGTVYYLIFPAIAIAIPKIAMTSRFLRNSILSEMNKNYVRTAYSKGNSDNEVLYKHVLKNALIPVITFLGIIIADIIAGSIIVEMVFNVPGLGRMIVTGITNRDYNVVQAGVVIVAAIVIIVNFLVDILYKVVDKRVQA